LWLLLWLMRFIEILKYFPQLVPQVIQIFGVHCTVTSILSWTPPRRVARRYEPCTDVRTLSDIVIESEIDRDFSTVSGIGRGSGVVAIKLPPSSLSRPAALRISTTVRAPVATAGVFGCPAE